jgi:hypothetical protein
MKLYFLLIDSQWFQETLTPALSASWRSRSFRPIQNLVADLRPAVQTFADQFNQGKNDSLIHHLTTGMPFDRDTWRMLVGEMLLYGASEMPELPNVFATLRCIVGSATHTSRSDFTPIEQVESGSRDLIFGGGFYRPEQAGFNNGDDVFRLAEYLNQLDAASWSPSTLEVLAELVTEEEREGELEFLRQEVPNLQKIYNRARDLRQVIVCERF